MMALAMRGRPLRWDMCLQAAVVMMPALGTMWLAVGGLLLGGEPGMSFRTALSPFRAARPVNAGTLAEQRLVAAAILWLSVWIPWLVLLGIQLRWHPEWAQMDLMRIQGVAGRTMAISAHALAGALPLFLWGRLQGFPNLLLGALVAWAITWGLTDRFSAAPEEGQGWTLLVAALAAKFILGLAGLVWAWRRGHITSRFAAGLCPAWLLIWCLLVFRLPTWSVSQGWGAATVALFLPFARLAWAPAALAANRHR